MVLRATKVGRIMESKRVFETIDLGVGKEYIHK